MISPAVNIVLEAAAGVDRMAIDAEEVCLPAVPVVSHIVKGPESASCICGPVFCIARKHELCI
jgi:hypothetical protein